MLSLQTKDSLLTHIVFLETSRQSRQFTQFTILSELLCFCMCIFKSRFEAQNITKDFPTTFKNLLWDRVKKELGISVYFVGG